ncbi:non-heme iron oxygenase ferredoxin subunit [Falsiroseomonas sp.]|uniref:non-heme iron oxygenase ferredoxin subunit n=1 Tax=Falsiroseomonas sp. TaxID=2870721 RepID=UPI002721C17A|nr:non-heme iron oxygenase ferredoxin subunit [Falsiroseomonas sp.]MDO9499085.1 non-heme iron oxygenase ferredoxin subunit [Falsiroseomonas sp.]
MLRLCPTTHVPEGEGRKVETAEGDFAVFNLRGVFFVTQNACSHGPGHLGEGRVIGDEVECAAHAGRFDIRTGQATAEPCWEPLLVWDVTIEDGQVCIQLDQGRTA